MGFLGIVRRKGLFGITWGVPGANTWETAWNFAHGLPLSKPGAMTQPYAQHAVVATAISIFVGDAASVGWELYPEGNQDDLIEEHPLLDFLKKPDPRFSGYQLWIGTYLSLKLWGEAFWYYPQLDIGRPGGLRATRRASGTISLVDPRMLRVDASTGAPIWKLKTATGDVTLNQDSLTQFKRPNPYDPFRGLSELDAIRMEIEGDHAAMTYNSRFFSEQGGMPSGFLIPAKDDMTPPKERMEFEQRFNVKHAAQRSFAAVAPPGWSWQSLGIAPKDMEFAALREYSREQILAIFGVPPFYAGVLDKANYANAREQKEIYWLGTMARFLTGIQETINADFLPKVGISGVEFWPCWEKVKALTENLSEKMTIAREMFAMGWPKRIINDRLDLGLDVDALEDADTGYLPFNVVPVSMVLEPPAPVQPVPGDTEDEDEDDTDEPEKKPRKALPPSEAAEHRRTLVWRNLVVRVRDIELRFNAGIRKHFHEIEQEVLENINGLKGWRAVRQKADADVNEIMFNFSDAVRRLLGLANPLHTQAVKRGGESVFSDLGMSVSFDMADPRVVAKIAELTQKIVNVDRTVESALRVSLSKGLSDGEGVGQLAKRVRDVMGASRARSMTIARTETGFAFNSGRHIGMQEAGVEFQEWVTARDLDVRDAHQSLDGSRAKIGEAFVDRDGTQTGMLYPQDPSGPPEMVINCRCVALPVFASR